MQNLRSDKYMTYELLNDMRDMGLKNMASDFEMLRKEGLSGESGTIDAFEDLCQNELRESGFIKSDIDEVKIKFLIIFMYQLGNEAHMKAVDEVFEEVRTKNED